METIGRNRRPGNEMELFQILEETLTQIIVRYCAGYYRHILKFLPYCFRSEPIIEE
jgi:hypothetical protein